MFYKYKAIFGDLVPCRKMCSTVWRSTSSGVKGIVGDVTQVGRKWTQTNTTGSGCNSALGFTVCSSKACRHTEKPAAAFAVAGSVINHHFERSSASPPVPPGQNSQAPHKLKPLTIPPLR